MGRIPFYGNLQDLDHILQKIMTYENEDVNQIGWRNSALLAAEGANRIFFVNKFAIRYWSRMVLLHISL